MTCECASGTITNDQKICNQCDKRCAVCNHLLNVDCDMCADGAYKVYESECALDCPEGYLKDDINHICSFDMSLLNRPEKPEDPTKGCVDGFFWDVSKKNCSHCLYSCLTCELSSSRCTSCPNGRYLTSDYRCETCEDFWKDDMIIGSSGACLETCGDG